MTKSLMLTAAAALFAGAAYMTPAAAVQLPGGPAVETTPSQVQTVQYRQCRYWRHECAQRWGWGTWRFRRCMRNHGC